MSAAEVVELIRNLPKEERDEVVVLVNREFGGQKQPGAPKSYEEAKAALFSKHGTLLKMLSQ